MSILKIIGTLLILSTVVAAIYMSVQMSSFPDIFDNKTSDAMTYVYIGLGALTSIAIIYGLFFVLPKRFK